MGLKFRPAKAQTSEVALTKPWLNFEYFALFATFSPAKELITPTTRLYCLALVQRTRISENPRHSIYLPNMPGHKRIYFLTSKLLTHGNETTCLQFDYSG